MHLPGVVGEIVKYELNFFSHRDRISGNGVSAFLLGGEHGLYLRGCFLYLVEFGAEVAAVVEAYEVERQAERHEPHKRFAHPAASPSFNSTDNMPPIRLYLYIFPEHIIYYPIVLFNKKVLAKPTLFYFITSIVIAYLAASLSGSFSFTCSPSFASFII